MPAWKNSNLLQKTAYSLNGLRSAFLSEKAVRNETMVLAVMVIATAVSGHSWLCVLKVFLACLFPILVELINTAAEIIIDLLLGHIYRDEVGVAKDMLSAAVMLSLFISYGYSLMVIFGV